MNHKLLLRSLLYKLFAILFIYPSKDNLDILQNQICASDRLKQIFEDIYNIDNNHLTYQLINSITSTIMRLTLEEWEKLYISTFGHAVGDIPLYETKYFPYNTFQESQKLADINAFYNAFGLKVSKSAREKLDHISIELDFISFLLQKESIAISENNNEHISICQDTLKKFFNDHFSKWVLKFCERLINYSKCEFYKTIGKLFQIFLTHEFSLLTPKP